MSIKPSFEYNQRLHEAWFKYSDQYQATEQCLQQHIPVAIHKVFPKVDDKSFNILSIGSGNGDVDEQFLTAVVACLDRKDECHEIDICNTALEPNPTQLQLYKDSIQRKSQSFKKSSKIVIKFDLQNKTFEEYQHSSQGKNRFDVIHGVYSFGFLDNPKSALKHCYENELKKRGFIAAVMANGESNDVFQMAASILSKHRPESQGIRHDPWLSSSDFPGHANSNYERFPFSSILDVTDIFNENSENASLLIDIITCENNFCQTAEKRVVDEVRLLVRELAFENNQGRLVINIDNELILIYKSGQ